MNHNNFSINRIKIWTWKKIIMGLGGGGKKLQDVGEYSSIFCFITNAEVSVSWMMTAVKRWTCGNSGMVSVTMVSGNWMSRRYLTCSGSWTKTAAGSSVMTSFWWQSEYEHRSIYNYIILEIYFWILDGLGLWNANVCVLAIDYVLFNRNIILFKWYAHAEFCRPAFQLILFQVVKAWLSRLLKSHPSSFFVQCQYNPIPYGRVPLTKPARSMYGKLSRRWTPLETAKSRWTTSGSCTTRASIPSSRAANGRPTSAFGTSWTLSTHPEIPMEWYYTLTSNKLKCQWFKS